MDHNVLIYYLDIPLSITPILDVPLGGSSLMTFISTPYPPDIGLQIRVNFVTQYKGLSLDKEVIDFPAGAFSVNFTIISSNDPNALGASTQKGTLSIILDGVNRDIYTLSTSSMDFNLISSDTLPPLLLQFILSSGSLTTASFLLQINEPVHFYYMLALKGTKVATLAMVKKSGNPPFPSTRTIYGFYAIRTAGNFSFTLEDLEGNTEYVLYGWIEDRGGMGGDKVYNVTFKTEGIFI